MFRGSGYANYGSLEDYFSYTRPPTNTYDLIAFWTSMFETLAGLQDGTFMGFLNKYERSGTFSYSANQFSDVTATSDLPIFLLSRWRTIRRMNANLSLVMIPMLVRNSTTNFELRQAPTKDTFLLGLITVRAICQYIFSRLITF